MTLVTLVTAVLWIPYLLKKVDKLAPPSAGGHEGSWAKVEGWEHTAGISSSAQPPWVCGPLWVLGWGLGTGGYHLRGGGLGDNLMSSLGVTLCWVGIKATRSFLKRARSAGSGSGPTE